MSLWNKRVLICVFQQLSPMYPVLLSLAHCCATADGRSGRAALAACAARRWLARTAAGIKRIGTYDTMGPAAWTSLICCLPALEHAFLHFDGDLVSDDVACLLEALAGCPRLKSLSLLIYCFEDAEDGGLSRPIPDASAFAKLSSLTYLALRSWEADCFIVPDVVAALASLTALAELNLDLPQAAVVPAALGRCKGLRSLALSSFSPCVLEVGCLELPNLQSLEFNSCDFDEDLRLLPGVSALQQLTRLEFQGNQAVCEFDPGLVRLGHLQRLVLSPDNLRCAGSVDAAPPRLLWLPADMGLLSLSLLHLDLAGL